MKPLTFAVQLRTRAPTNSRVSHWTRAARTKAERRAVAWAWLGAGGALKRPTLPVKVSLTRVAPNELDWHDNLPAALKGVVDELAHQLGLKSDRDPRVMWAYLQRRGGVREYAVEVLIEARPETCPTCGRVVA